MTKLKAVKLARGGLIGFELGNLTAWLAKFNLDNKFKRWFSGKRVIIKDSKSYVIRHELENFLEEQGVLMLKKDIILPKEVKINGRYS